MKDIQMHNKKICTNCGRQIVDYNSSNDKYVGKSGHKLVRDVNGYICHECEQYEKEFYAMLEKQ